MPRRFDRFIAQLAAVQLTGSAYNQYSSIEGDLKGNAVRRRNLRLYLEELAEMSPDTVLIGEAPSHRGGRLTGIAFVSETVLLRGACGVLGTARGYRKATDSSQLSTEASATMVWSTIGAMNPLPVLWNAFPFHPFVVGNPLTNRVPTREELATGQPFIQGLLRLLPIRRVVAIGNQASRSLAILGIEHVKVRHPSMGGKQEFVEGMARLSQHPMAEAAMAKKSQIQDIKEGRSERERRYTGRNQPYGPKAPLPTKNAVKLSTVPSSAREKYDGGQDEGS